MVQWVIVSAVLAAVAVPARAEGPVKAPRGPAPRFVTVQRLDAEKGELVVSEECLPHPDVVSRTITKKEANRREDPTNDSTGSTRKLEILYYTTTHKLPLKQVTLYEAGGKKLPAKELSRLKPGVMVLLSADGHPVEAEYLALIKPGTRNLVVDVMAVPSPFESTESTEGIIKELRKPGKSGARPK